MKCWAFMKCGREAGGAKAKAFGTCPAYPHYGECCAPVAGTLSGGNIACSFAVRLGDCKKCEFYNSAHYVHTSNA